MSVAAFKLSPPMLKEKDIQAAILDYLQWDQRVQWAARFNVGASPSEYVDKQGRRKRYFVRWAPTGTPDILGMLKGGCLLGIECKRPDGRVRPAQRAFLDAIADGQGLAIVARSVGDVIRDLDQFCQARGTP